MKRLLYILLILLLLTGCAADTQETIVTEPSVSWIEETGKSWDAEGSLLELTLTIPNGMHYRNALAFDRDLLLWSVDDHLEGCCVLELCLVELDTGTVAAEREIKISGYASPQIMGDHVFLCDNIGGEILELDRNLQTVNSWEIDPVEGNLIMGSGEKLYVHEWQESFCVVDLKTGEKLPVMEDLPPIEYISVADNSAVFEFYDALTGERRIALLDLTTGQVMYPPADRTFNTLRYCEGVWLCDIFRDGYTYYICDESGQFMRAQLGYDSLQFIDRKTLLRTMDDGCTISLHDITGTSIAQAQLTATPYSHHCTACIPSDLYDGYFLLIEDYNSGFRLLYWDPAVGNPGEDILFEPIPEPAEAELQIKQRVEAIENAYGLDILIGEDCGTIFMDFTAAQVTDWDLLENALDTLEDALAGYPENFFPQLRYDSIHSIQIHLAGTLTATNTEYVDTYEAFVQDDYDCHIMVVDITLADEDTYYHEFSHIIDSFLEWDAMNRGDALFSEDAWCSLNPYWFQGYTYDYSWEQYVEDYSCFVDSYSTINPTEDRARVLEYAMADYGFYTFDGSEVLLNKLDYYCRCIRDAFDTSGWPEEVLWEQYLP